MGRKRLIVQADLTSEEDQAFLAWVKGKLRRRRLAEEIREGLRVRYQQARGQAAPAYLSASRVDQQLPPRGVELPGEQAAVSSVGKLRELVNGF